MIDDLFAVGPTFHYPVYAEPNDGSLEMYRLEPNDVVFVLDTVANVVCTWRYVVTRVGVGWMRSGVSDRGWYFMRPL